MLRPVILRLYGLCGRHMQVEGHFCGVAASGLKAALTGWVARELEARCVFRDYSSLRALRGGLFLRNKFSPPKNHPTCLHFH